MDSPTGSNPSTIHSIGGISSLSSSAAVIALICLNSFTGLALPPSQTALIVPPFSARWPFNPSNCRSIAAISASTAAFSSPTVLFPALSVPFSPAFPSLLDVASVLPRTRRTLFSAQRPAPPHIPAPMYHNIHGHGCSLRLPVR